MIRREDVADLREGDVVELTSTRYPGYVVRGPLRATRDSLCIGPEWFAYPGKAPASSWAEDFTLTVVSRAPRPLYVNHPTRTEPVPGDVANPVDGSSSVAFRTVCDWMWPNGSRARLADHGLRLLVDGTNGQVVQ